MNGRGQESQQQSQQSSTQLEFSQAMTDFKVMFPDLDVDVIEAVLRSNNGAVDATIDQLLTMTADNETGAGGNTGNRDTALPSYHEAVDTTDTMTQMFGAASVDDRPGPDLLSGLGACAVGGNTGHSGHQGASLRSIRNWNPPLLGKLPSDFLRLRSSSHHKPGHTGHSYTHQDRYHPDREHRRTRDDHHPEQPGASSSSSRNQQLLEDEKFAMMLQNEEFMRELRGNQEFMSALANDNDCDQEDHHQSHHQEYQDRPKDATTKKHHLMDDALFREKLKNMGKTSKQKFAKIATMFSRQRGVGRVLGHAPAPSKDNLLLAGDPVAHQRLEDSDTDEESHCTTKVSHFITLQNESPNVLI